MSFNVHSSSVQNIIPENFSLKKFLVEGFGFFITFMRFMLEKNRERLLLYIMSLVGILLIIISIYLGVTRQFDPVCIVFRSFIVIIDGLVVRIKSTHCGWLYICLYRFCLIVFSTSGKQL
jgi:hypothetical protein